MKSSITNEQLKEIRDTLIKSGNKVRAWMIKQALKDKYNTTLDESTIRGRFLEMKEPLSSGIGQPTQKDPVLAESSTKRGDLTKTLEIDSFTITEQLKTYVPNSNEFIGYVRRPVDTRLAIHYNIGPETGNYKYPVTQGKQGTGKTFGHMYYAWTHKLPFFLYSCHEDFKLRKLFGDKTIKNGSIEFQESIFVEAIQSPSVMLFDEIQAPDSTFDFHAMLQNRELYVRDADGGRGKIYKLHPECRVGFAQNPRSEKYIGGKIQQSSFFGRCTFITYPEFSKKDIKSALHNRFTSLMNDDLDKFVTFYFACVKMISKSSLPFDISIRQLNNVVELWLHGMPLAHALEDGLISMTEAVSQPKAKEAFQIIAEGVWKELMTKPGVERTTGEVGTAA